MDLSLVETMVRAGACREFEDRDVPDDLLVELFSSARFAPSGGNRQPTRFVVIRDSEVKHKLGQLYLSVWEPYYEGVKSGEIGADVKPSAVESADRFARSFHEVPVMLMVCADPSVIQMTDLELDRPSLVGGASIYPFVQNLILLCRQAGLGASITTLLCGHEGPIKEILDIPDEYAVVGTVVLGWPARPLPTKLKRLTVPELVFSERFGNPIGTNGKD
ncbi:MAG: nitroreductase family protein [Actinomycetota bacterium]|nr:nitroreductase family protein [Actinomycetota bacterium]